MRRSNTLDLRSYTSMLWVHHVDRSYSDEHRRINLNLATLKDLDNAIVESYENWIEEAPVSYKQDNFFPARRPVAVTSRFGQNQQLADTEPLRVEERSNWARECDYTRIRFITIALATHLRYFVFISHHFIHTILFHRVRVVNSWRDRDVNQIIQYHPDGVFTSFDPVDRRRILWNELTNMDILDAAGSEIPIYCGKGFTVPRRIPRFSRNTLPHGVLMDLRSVKDLFQTPWEDDIDLGLDDEDSPDITCYTYPQAGLKVAGHFQAAGLMKKFSPFVKAVNQDLIDDDDDLTSPPIVSGIACQGYNAVMHSTRGNSAQHHDAQLGLITGALAGSWAKGGPAERTAHRLSERCSRKLPHASFAEKIQNDLILRDLRLENVFYIDVQALKPHHQHGM